MIKFKIGDKVKCTGMNPTYMDKLTVGKIYTISHITGSNMIYVEENKAKNCYGIGFFELIKKDTPKTEIEFLDRLKENEENYYE